MPPNISRQATPAMRTSLNMKSMPTTNRERMPGSSRGSSINPRISTSRCWASRRKLLNTRSYTPLPNCPRNRASSTNTIVFLMRGEAASLIAAGYSHRPKTGATAIFQGSMVSIPGSANIIPFLRPEIHITIPFQATHRSSHLPVRANLRPCQSFPPPAEERFPAPPPPRCR